MRPDSELIAEELQEKYDTLSAEGWGKHPYFTREDWQSDVAMGDTRLGYWPWVEHQIESATDQFADADPGSYLAFLAELPALLAGAECS
jgi:hypothetical protein